MLRNVARARPQRDAKASGPPPTRAWLGEGFRFHPGMPATFSPARAAVNATRGRTGLAVALLVLATFLAYANSFQGPFIFDDKPAILDNPTIRQLWPLTKVLSPPPVGSSVTGRPLVNLSLAANYAISGEEVWSYHAANLLIHLVAGLALFGVVRRTLLFPSAPERLRAAALPLGLATAGLWLLHPLQTESVTSVIQRTESLVGAFYLLTLYCFARTLASPAARGWPVLTVTLCLLGMATKEVMVTAPVVALLYDRTFVAGTFRAAWQSRWRLYLALAATWLLLAWLVLGGGGTRGEAAGFGLGVTPFDYALTQCRAVVRYLKLACFPFPLVLDYGTGLVRTISQIWPQAALLLGLLAGTAWAVVRRPLAGFAAAAFFIVLAPSSSVVPLVSQTIAEHRMYLPLAAFLALVLTATYLRLGRVALGLAAVVAAGFGAGTWARNADYRSAVLIWADTVKREPANARAQLNLAESLLVAGQVAEAVSPAREAVRLRPEYPEAQSNLAIALAQTGHPADALPHAQEAVRLQPHDARARATLGAVLSQLQRWEEAVPQLEQSLRLAPGSRDTGRVRNNLGFALMQAGRAAAAVPELETAVREDPARVEAHYNLAVAYGLTERLPAAAEQLEIVLRLQPDHTEARNALEQVRAELKR